MAVSSSISSYYNKVAPWLQCHIVSMAFSDPTCCVNGGTTACNQPYFLHTALHITQNLNTWVTRALTYAETDNEIALGHPVGVRIAWNGGGGHFVAITATQQNWVEVMDPWSGMHRVPYDIAKFSYKGGGAWSHSYITQS
jgi:hypothetical protein